MATCFTDEEEKQFIHIESFSKYEGCNINRYIFGNSLTESNFLKYFSSYGSEFYYYIFSKIENAEIERRFGRYFTSLKKKISIQDHKWLINKIRALKERKVPEHVLEKPDLWICYYEGEKTDEKLIDYPILRNKYLEMYEQYLEYVNSMNNLNYNSIILWITSITLIVTILGIILTIK